MSKDIFASPILLKNTMAVHSSAPLSLLQRKSINILLKNAFKDKNISEDVYHEFPIRDLMTELGYKEGNRSFSDALKMSLFELSEINVKWNILKKDNTLKTIGQSAYLASISLENGVIQYTFSKHMRDIFFRPNLYAKLNLDYQKDFSNKYSLPLWELMCEEISTKKANGAVSKWLEYQKVLELFALDDSYYQNNYKHFKSKILNPIIKEVNQKSDICIKLEERKTGGKKVTALRFIAEKKEIIDVSNDLEELVATAHPTLYQAESNDSNIDINILVERMKNIVSIKTATSLLKKYSMRSILNALNFCENSFKSNKTQIKNPVAFFKKALEEGWVLPEVINQRIEQGSEISEIDPIESEIEHLNEPETIKALRFGVLKSIGAAPYKAWIHPLVFKVDKGSMQVIARNTYLLDRVENHYRPELEAQLRKQLKGKAFPLTFLVESEPVAQEA